MINFEFKTFLITKKLAGVATQIGRFLRGKIISYFRQKLAFFDTLKEKFLVFFLFFFLGGGGGGVGGCHSPTMQLSSGTAIV